jgi:NAD(P)-dependent dehydrogenase (short-subunit alcohol dehydrogenase family)
MGVLDGQVAVLTASESEFDAPIVAMLAREGARLAVVVRPGADTRPLIAALPPGAIANFYEAGSDSDDVMYAVKAIDGSLGTPGILVTLPVRPIVAPSAELSEADFRSVLDNTLVHAFLWSQSVGRLMRASKRGVIVHVTGLSGLGGWPGWLAEGAAYAGIHNLTHTLAVEWAKDGVRVNCLVPGVTDEALSAIVASPRAPTAEAVEERIPAERIATPKDIADALLYLVHPKSSFVSGEILKVDGGWDSWGRFYAVAARK